MGDITTNGRASARGHSAAEARSAVTVSYADRRRGLRRELLLDAACALLLEQPWEGLSMLDVAALAEVHRSSLYSEFGTRRNLGRALIAREAARLSRTFARALALNASSPALSLKETFDCFLTATRENGLIAAVLRPGETELRALAGARKGEMLAALSGSVAEAWPLLPKGECEQIAQCLFRFALSLARKPAGRSTAGNVGGLLGAYVEDRLRAIPSPG